MENRRGLRGAPPGENRDNQGDGRGDNAGQRPPERDAGAGCRQERRGERHGAHDTEGRRAQMRAHAQETLAGAVVLDDGADVEPGPPSDEHAHVTIVGPPFVHFNGANGTRRSEPAREIGEHAIGRGPRLAPEPVLDNASGEEQQRAPRLADRGSRTAARLTGRRGERHLGRREHAADLPHGPGEWLKEVEVRDDGAIPEPAARKGAHLGPERVSDVFSDGDSDPDRAAAKEQRRRPAVFSDAGHGKPASVRTKETACHRTECGRNAKG